MVLLPHSTVMLVWISMHIPPVIRKVKGKPSTRCPSYAGAPNVSMLGARKSVSVIRSVIKYTFESLITAMIPYDIEHKKNTR